MKKNRILIGGALTAATFLGAAGGSLLSAQWAGAASSAVTDSTVAATTATTTTGTGSQPNPSQGGHVGANGTKEVLLTGDTATKVTAAAQAAVPGGTVERVENDVEGSPYEAHMTKSDGSRVTVKVDSSFKVTNIETDGRHMQQN